MNFYPFHIGDYATATGHLSWLEDLAYRRLLDTYYLNESPLLPDVKALCRLLRAHEPAQQEAVKTVLEEFFQAGGEGWRHKRCEAEIAEVVARRNRATDAAQRRWGPGAGVVETAPHAGNAPDVPGTVPGNANEMPPTPAGNARGMLTIVGSNAPNPITSPNPKPITNPTPTPSPITSPPAAANQGRPPAAADEMSDTGDCARESPSASQINTATGQAIAPTTALPLTPSVTPTTEPAVASSIIAPPAASPAASDIAAPAAPLTAPDAPPSREQRAGAACKRMREAGITGANPSNADLLALIDEGVTPRQFADLAREIALIRPGVSMQYVMTALRNRFKEGALPPPPSASAFLRPAVSPSATVAPATSAPAGEWPVYGGYRPAVRAGGPDAYGTPGERI